MKRLYLFLVLCLFVSLAMQATRSDSLSKGRPAHYIGLEMRPSYVFPTRTFFRGENANGKAINTTFSAHLRYAFRFASDTRLGRLYPHTYQGIGLAYNNFFNKAEVGTPVALYAFQGAPIARLTKHLSIDYEWNFGAAFGWKKYDPVDNPYNVVVGSRVNAYLNLGLFLNWQPSPDWRLTAGVDLGHYSNGNTNYPNSGVNTLGARVGIVHAFGETRQEAKPLREKALPMKRRFSYDLILYASTRKRGLIYPDHGELIPGSFAVIGMNFNPMYRVNKYFRAGVSLDAQYDESANLMEYLAEETNGEMKFYRPPFREQFAVGLSLRAELNMPIFSVNIGIGRNVICKGIDTDVFYQVLALKAFVTRRFFLHVGYQLSDFKNPNNLMLGLGWRFGQP